MSEEKNGGQLFVKSLCLKFLLEMPSQTRSPDGDNKKEPGGMTVIQGTYICSSDGAVIAFPQNVFF